MAIATSDRQLPAPSETVMLEDTTRLVYRQHSAGLVGQSLGVIAITLTYWNVAPMPILLGWTGGFALLWVIRFFNLMAYERANLQNRAEPAHWYMRWKVGALIAAAFWGVLPFLMYKHGGHFERIVMMMAVYSHAIGSIANMSSQTRLFLTCMTMYFAPMIAVSIMYDAPYGLQLAGIWVLMCMGVLTLGRSFKNVFGEMVTLRMHTHDLAHKLHGEMKIAEAAQCEAEAANRAKTQFFAAASHDLRQPLHALGLFAEALRNHSKDDEVVHLVNSINSSVDALEGLFSELLDITKIDTGGMDIEPEHFAMRDLFTRIQLHFEPIAFEKGLMLSFHGDQHHCYADPLVAERILRNLVSNALRYTEDGGVLVSCRKRGEQLCLQVWDTGIGIAPKEQERIFEEFYQTQSNRPLQPHHRKGLGLGLAIVKRLADLMHAPLTLRSRVGRGTVFTLMLPIGRAPRMQPIGQSTKQSLGVTLDRRHIVVVEDEQAVLQGLQVLLKGWGATVSAFDSVAAVTEWVARFDASHTPRPDLLMVDYRLPNQQTGIDAIKVMRERFGPDLPAILVTGSTMTHHEQEARQHQFHVLLKPVVPTKLSAMIAFKLGLR